MFPGRNLKPFSAVLVSTVAPQTTSLNTEKRCQKEQRQLPHILKEIQDLSLSHGKCVLQHRISRKAAAQQHNSLSIICATDAPSKASPILSAVALESCISTVCSFFFNLLDGGNEYLSTRCKPNCPGGEAGAAQSHRARHHCNLLDGWLCLGPNGFHMRDHLSCRRHCH